MLYKTEAGEVEPSGIVPCKANSIFRTSVDFFFFSSTWHSTDGGVGGCGLRSEVVHKDIQSYPRPTLRGRDGYRLVQTALPKIVPTIPVGGPCWPLQTGSALDSRMAGDSLLFSRISLARPV